MKFRTTIVDRTKMLVTVRQAASVIFPFIKPSTIALWIREGIFRPVLHSRGAAGPGKGSKLDFWDLVLMGVMHSLFASGVRFRHLQLHGRTFETARIGLQRPLPKGVLQEIGGRTKPWPARMGNAHFGGIVEWDYVDSLAHRQVQAYIEGHACDVVVSVRFKRPLDQLHEDRLMVGEGPWLPLSENVAEIWFAPLKDMDCYTDYIGAVQPYERHAFINCQHWGSFVQNRLTDLC